MKAIRFSIYFLTFLSVVWIMHSCAVEAAPLGGPLDDTPPYPDSTNSDPNNQLFFEKQNIVLSFK